MITNKRFFVKFGYIIAAVSGIIMALPLIFPALGILQWLAFIPTALCLYIFADDVKIRLRKLCLLTLDIRLMSRSLLIHELRSLLF